LAKDHKIFGYRHDDDYWLDIGKIEQLEQLSGNSN